MKLILITGQTATGKTSRAFEYAQKENGELVNCDSRQIYKCLDIITGKDSSGNFICEKNRGDFNVGFYNVSHPSYQQAGSSPHTTRLWLYDIVSPNQYFSSFDYVQCALFVIHKILDQEKTPIIVGGTYLYFKHLLYSIETEHIPPDWDLRKKLANKTVEKLQDELKTIDADFFNRLNESEKQNPQRLIRKIEIALSPLYHSLPLKNFPKQPYSLPYKLNMKNIPIQFIGLKYATKERLISAIKQRVEKRIQQGAFEEVETLLKKGYTAQDPGIRTIGYQQIIKYLQGLCTKEQAKEEWTTKEIQYAKRQYTFMKKDENIIWEEV